MGVTSRANHRLRELGYRRAEAAVVGVPDDPDWLLVSGTLVRPASVRKDEALAVVERLPERAAVLRARCS